MSKVLVVGANGALGREILAALGPRKVVAVSRKVDTPLTGFPHVRLRDSGELPLETVTGATCLINAAGRVTGTENELHQANVELPVMLAAQSKAAGLGKFIQVSSFSVYGDVERIDGRSPISPSGAYGASKALAEEKLSSLQGRDFAIESVRLPFLFGPENPALFGPLLKVCTRLPVWPVARDRVERSMLTYRDAAFLLAQRASMDTRGTCVVADPIPFDFEMLSRLLREELGHSLNLLALPRFVTQAIGAVSPSINRRLFHSSLLVPEANDALPFSLPAGLEATLRELIVKEYA